MLAKSRNTKLKKYRRFVSKKDSPELCSFFGKINLPSIIGDKSFVDWVKNTFFSGKIDHNISQARTLAPSITEIKNIVCEYYQIDEQEINLSRRGKGNLPRDVAMYLMRSVSGEALLCIGEAMGIKNYSSVSSAVHRIKNKLSKDKQLEKDIRQMWGMIINKSQTET